MQSGENGQDSDIPLPPLKEDMNLARPELFIALKDDSFVYNPALGVEVRDLGLGALSDGCVAGQVFRASPDRPKLPGFWHMHDLRFQVGYITHGWGLYEFEGVGKLKLEAGTCIYHLPRNRLRMLDCSADFQGIWIKSSNRDKITGYQLDQETGELVEKEIIAELG